MVYFSGSTPTGQGYLAFGIWNFDTADDIIAHEFTHLVTSKTSKLAYLNEGSALHESFSDIWGEFIDWSGGWSVDDPADKWKIGEDTTIFGVPSYVRNMQVPEISPLLGGAPLYQGVLWYLLNDPHYRAGVGNKLCYLMTDGDLLSEFPSLPMTALGATITRNLFWECQKNLLGRVSDYRHLYFALTQAAVNLGLNANQRATIQNACTAVNIASQPVFVIRDVEGKDLVQFRSNGDMYEVI